MMITELFGPSIQGEGRHAGRLVKFVRLAGCNLACTFCDTAYSREPGHEASEEAIAQRLSVARGDTVVITGGEPTLQDIGELTLLLHHLGAQVHLETNGSLRMPSRQWVDYIAVSPKLDDITDAYAESLVWYAQSVGADFKFVIRDEADVRAAMDLAELVGIARDHVWFMPEGAGIEAQLEGMRLVAEWAIESGVNFSPRLHVLCWDTRKGV